MIENGFNKILINSSFFCLQSQFYEPQVVFYLLNYELALAYNQIIDNIYLLFRVLLLKNGNPQSASE